ncbi:MAG: hypothetical protein NVS9B14_02930 [Candidatus Acidiferrum sp.]
MWVGRTTGSVQRWLKSKKAGFGKPALLNPPEKEGTIYRAPTQEKRRQDAGGTK